MFSTPTKQVSTRSRPSDHGNSTPSPRTPTVSTPVSRSRPQINAPEFSTHHVLQTPRNTSTIHSARPSTPSAQIDVRVNNRDPFADNLAPGGTDSFLTPLKPVPRPRRQGKENAAVSRDDEELQDQSFAPEDVALLEGDGQARAQQSPQSRIAHLRIKLKIWEKQFEDSHGGRKAGTNDIRGNVKVAARYREYHRLRELVSKKAPELNFGDATSSKVAPHSPTANQSFGLGFTTPKGKGRVLARPAKEMARLRLEERLQRNDGLEPPPSPDGPISTPVTQRIATYIGPTPQRNGHVLGLFDSLSPTKSRIQVSPSPSSRKLHSTQALTNQQACEFLTVPVSQFSTPKRSRPDDDSGSDACWTGRAKKWQRTPASEGKRFFMERFVTPTKKSKLGLSVTSPSPLTGRRESFADFQSNVPRNDRIGTSTNPEAESALVAATPLLQQRYASSLGATNLLASPSEQEQNDTDASLDLEHSEELGPMGVSSFAGRLSRATSTAGTPAAGGHKLLTSSPRKPTFKDPLDEADFDTAVDDTLLGLDCDQDVPQSVRNVLKSSPFMSLVGTTEKPRIGDSPPTFNPSRSITFTSTLRRSTSGVTKRSRLPFGAGAGGRTLSTAIQRMRESEKAKAQREEQDKLALSAEATAWDDQEPPDFDVEEEIMREMELTEIQHQATEPDGASLGDLQADSLVPEPSAITHTEAEAAPAVGEPAPMDEQEAPFLFGTGGAEFADRFDENLEYQDFDPDVQDGYVRKWKKKGQKRTTRLIKIKPSLRIGPDPDGYEAELRKTASATNSQVADGSTLENGGDSENPSVVNVGEETGAKGKRGRKPVAPKPARKYDPNTPAHMNFQRLHIKDRGAKRGRGGFRR